MLNRGGQHNRLGPKVTVNRGLNRDGWPTATVNIINRGGYFKVTASVNTFNQGGYLNTTASVNLLNVVFILV
jgi:hypothetical protein